MEIVYTPPRIAQDMQLAEEIYSKKIFYHLACGHYALRYNAWSLKRPLPEQRPNAECAAQPSFFVPVQLFSTPLSFDF